MIPLFDRALATNQPQSRPQISAAPALNGFRRPIGSSADGELSSDARAPFKSLPAGAASPASAPGPNLILVVDDDPSVQTLLAIGLRRTGYRVECREDGEAGWAALRESSFDLLITDHNMPKLTGVDLLRRLRAVPLHLPAILLSGNLPTQEPDLPRLLHPGAALAKPVLWTELLRQVRLLLHATPLPREEATPEGFRGSAWPASVPPSLGRA